MKKFFTKWLVVPDTNRTKNGIFIWWEKRRLIFNFFLILSYMISLALQMYISNLAGFDPDFSDSMLFIIIPFFIVIANVLYFGGWGLQVIIRKMFKNRFNILMKYLFLFVISITVCAALYYPGIMGVLWYFRI